jgi:ATP-dependent Clp protease adaptor protein ClpS
MVDAPSGGARSADVLDGGILSAMHGMGTLAPPEIKRRSKGPADSTGNDEPAHIIVLNDDHNTFEHVARTLAAVIPNVDYERGMAFATRIHTAGRARVWSGHRERAELYWNQLHEAGLTLVPLGER